MKRGSNEVRSTSNQSFRHTRVKARCALFICSVLDLSTYLDLLESMPKPIIRRFWPGGEPMRIEEGRLSL